MGAKRFRSWLLMVPAAFVLGALGLVIVYNALPFIQPCAVLSRALAPALLPPNPNAKDESFAPLPGARAIAGQYACSTYRIEVPNNWNGDLVIYAHGFTGAGAALTVVDLPVRSEAIADGMAWAASSYRANGYNPEDGEADSILLLDLFKKKVGIPKRVFIYGTSMGGHVVVLSLEHHPDIYAGGIAECGAIGGAAELDYLIGVNALADYFARTDLFAAENRGLAAQMSLVKDKLYPAIGTPTFAYATDAVHGGVDVAVPPVALTAKGRAFRDAAINLGGGRRPFALQGFSTGYRLTVETPRALLALIPRLVRAGTNAAVDYHVDSGLDTTSAEVNAGVRRVSADPKARARFEVTGNLRAPLLTMFDTGDFFVPPLNELIYRRLVQANGNQANLVQRAVRRFVHCDFSPAEQRRAFEDFVKWVDTGTKPAGDDLKTPLLDAGKKWTQPLRQDDPSL